MRITFPASATQTAPPPTVMPSGPPPTFTVAVTRLTNGSIRLALPSPSTIHMNPSPNAPPERTAPRSICFTTRLVAGLIRATTPWKLFPRQGTHTDPARTRRRSDPSGCRPFPRPRSRDSAAGGSGSTGDQRSDGSSLRSGRRECSRGRAPGATPTPVRSGVGTVVGPAAPFFRPFMTVMVAPINPATTITGTTIRSTPTRLLRFRASSGGSRPPGGGCGGPAPGRGLARRTDNRGRRWRGRDLDGPAGERIARGPRQRGARREAVLLRLRHPAGDHRVDAGRQLPPLRAHRGGLVGEVGGDDLRLHLPFERRRPREAFVQDSGERVLVGAAVERLGLELFGRAVLERAEVEPRLGELRGRVRPLRETEVREEHLAGRTGTRRLPD